MPKITTTGCSLASVNMPQLGTHVEAMQVGDTLVVVEATMVS